jgi:hypothetical protein
MWYQDLLGRWFSFISKKAHACSLNFVDTFFTTHENSIKIAWKIKKSGTKSQDILVLRKNVVSRFTPMLARWILWKNALLRMRNAHKLLEKSKNLELNPRKFWSYCPRMKICSIKIYSLDDLVSSPKNIMLAGWILWKILAEFLGLLGNSSPKILVAYSFGLIKG